MQRERSGGRELGEREPESRERQGEMGRGRAEREMIGRGRKVRERSGLRERSGERAERERSEG